MSDNATDEPENQRAYSRFKVEVPIELESASGTTVKGHMVNLSRAGVLASVDRPMRIGEACWVRFPKGGDDVPTSRAGRITRSWRGHEEFAYMVAVKFDEVMPIPY